MTYIKFGVMPGRFEDISVDLCSSAEACLTAVRDWGGKNGELAGQVLQGGRTMFDLALDGTHISNWGLPMVWMTPGSTLVARVVLGNNTHTCPKCNHKF